ncbi:MAG: CDP-diacylglycerol--glycerol-3-phosphate 3-phosphatidyltransferase [Elusimicrobia bacterium]|nr:CDP-diacylglycerol--glycerol-3-phosphate 3-phosphatidyltransferase [Elusimicrobiota bacterium]
MTLANKLTLARLAMAPVTFGCLWSQKPRLYAVALALYLLAVLTDWVDGYVARKTGSVSPFGALADPVADKVLVIGALIAFLRIPGLEVPNWAVFLIIARELLIGALRALAAISGKVHGADRAGKWSMAVQSVCVFIILSVLSAEANGLYAPQWACALPHTLVLLCLAVSWASGALYVYRARPLLRRSWNAPSR